ncbi:MAG: hypothetical protein IKE73_00735 [Bacilli bacterium]|nr:hypothetical protein [Bacilli bacterium]
MDKKKIGIIAGAAVVVIAIVVGLILFLNKSNEKQLNTNLTKLGKQFYEEFYYPSQEKSQEDVKAFVKKFEKTGIKVNLENIKKISKVDQNLVKAMVNSKTKKDCDAKESYVIIYPEKPYGKTNYKIEVNLECGFKK